MNGTRTTTEVIGLNGTTVRDAMHEGVLSCPTSTPLSTVAELMAGNGVHCVVVTDEREASGGGVGSDRPLAGAAGVGVLPPLPGGGPAATPALAVAPSETLQRAAQMMTEHAAAHLLVVDQESGRPVGVLSTLDIARLLAERFRT